MSSKRRMRRKGCAGKVKHATQAAAVAHAISLLRKDGESLGTYRCRFCKKWHVGHPIRKKEER